MKKNYVIVGAYDFTDKKTGEKKYWITGILQTKYPVKWTRDFYLSENEFHSLFSEYYDQNDYNLGLKGLYLVINEQLSVEVE